MSTRGHLARGLYVRIRANMRWIRLAVFAAALVGAAYLAHRFDVIRLDPHGGGAWLEYPPGSNVLVDTWRRDDLQCEWRVTYRFSGETYYRVGRILAVSGQRISTQWIEGDGERLQQILVDGAASGVYLREGDETPGGTEPIPSGHVYVVDLMPGSQEPDSRNSGPFPTARILGRALVRLPF